MGKKTMFQCYEVTIVFGITGRSHHRFRHNRKQTGLGASSSAQPSNTSLFTNDADANDRWGSYALLSHR
jgi:hypothetical protein